MMPEGALLDTSFFIRLLNEEDALFTNADNYYKYCLDKNLKLFISTISIAEYCVGGLLAQLPLRNLIVLPFNIGHAQKAGEFARIIYEARKNNKIEVNERPIIINDLKLFSQAHVDDRIQYFITSDTRSLNFFNIIKSRTNIDFRFIDLRVKYTETFGLLDF